MRRVTDGIDAHAAARPDCRACGGTGLVCEAHPTLPWGGVDPAGCDCGAPGMECPLIRGEDPRAGLLIGASLAEYVAWCLVIPAVLIVVILLTWARA